MGEAILNAFKLDPSGQEKAGKTEARANLVASFKKVNKTAKSGLLDLVERLSTGQALRSELRGFLAAQSRDYINKHLEFFKGNKFLQIKKLEEFDWRFSNKTDVSVPKRALYYSSLKIPKDSRRSAHQEPEIEGGVKISIGNTTMEALSAYLAHQLADEFRIDPADPSHAEPLVGYKLRLMSVGNTDELLKEGRPLVIVASVNSVLRVRIFDGNGARIVDKPESDLVQGKTFDELKGWLGKFSFNDPHGMSEKEEEEKIQSAASIAGYNRMERLEDQLESLHLSGKLANRKLDIGPKFREARHSSGFIPVSGGKRWAVRLQSRGPTSPIQSVAGKNGSEAGKYPSAQAAPAQAQRRVILTPEMTSQLKRVEPVAGRFGHGSARDRRPPETTFLGLVQIYDGVLSSRRYHSRR